MTRNLIMKLPNEVTVKIKIQNTPISRKLKKLIKTIESRNMFNGPNMPGHRTVIVNSIALPRKNYIELKKEFKLTKSSTKIVNFMEKPLISHSGRFIQITWHLHDSMGTIYQTGAETFDSF